MFHSPYFCDFLHPASWKASGKETGGAPQLKGARWFSYDELKKCTNNFSETNQIGSGGYGKVDNESHDKFFFF